MPHDDLGCCLFEGGGSVVYCSSHRYLVLVLLLSILSCFTIILMTKGELVALLILSF